MCASALLLRSCWKQFVLLTFYTLNLQLKFFLCFFFSHSTSELRSPCGAAVQVKVHVIIVPCQHGCVSTLNTYTSTNTCILTLVYKRRIRDQLASFRIRVSRAVATHSAYYLNPIENRKSFSASTPSFFQSVCSGTLILSYFSHAAIVIASANMFVVCSSHFEITCAKKLT